MAVAKTISVDELTREAKKYQDDLRMYPYYVLGPELAAMGINLMQSEEKDVLVSMQRKGGIMKPYSTEKALAYSDLGKFVESVLELKTSYAAKKDHLKNYRAKQILNGQMLAGSAQNQTKRLPIEDLLTSGAVRTFSEDVLDCLFAGTYDIDDQTPTGAFDGFDKKITDAVTATTVAEANGNLVATGAITAPANETDYGAINDLVAILRGADPFLRKRPALLYVTPIVYQYAFDALEYKYKYKDITVSAIEAYINDKAGAKVKLIPHHAMGKGDRVILTVPGNFDLGVQTFGDQDFVQVRSPFEDPNIFQYWLQADFGTRIRSFHKKLFCTNDGTPNHTDTELSGDYRS